SSLARSHRPPTSPPFPYTTLFRSRLHHATQDTLRTWIERLRKATGDGFPEGVTAFREEMAVHGRYRKPCPVCGSPVQRIRYAEKDRKSTRLNSSHLGISYAVFCLK